MGRHVGDGLLDLRQAVFVVEAQLAAAPCAAPNRAQRVSRGGAEPLEPAVHARHSRLFLDHHMATIGDPRRPADGTFVQFWPVGYKPLLGLLAGILAGR